VFLSDFFTFLKDFRFSPVKGQARTGPCDQQHAKRKVMNDKFDDLAKGLAQSATRRQALRRFGVGLAGIALATLFAGKAHAADLYADASVNANGDGTAARPYWRITDAVERARLLRQTAAITLNERIVIHVAPGAYLGSKANPVLNHNPRYEALPILLNVPNLTLAGATVLTLDGRGLPTGMVPGTETLLGTEDHYNSTGHSLILLSRTTDGLVGDDVAVSGFHLDYLNGRAQGDCAIRLDRVLRFTLRHNLLTRANIGIYATRASGSIECNLITQGASGVAAKGGSRAHPSQYLITGNRSVASRSSGLVIEADGLGRQINVGANKVELEPLPSSESRDDPPFTTVATLVGNDTSAATALATILELNLSVAPSSS
jgi:hypothetical protein